MVWFRLASEVEITEAIASGKYSDLRGPRGQHDYKKLTEIEEADTSLQVKANDHKRVYTSEDLFLSSGYLIMEQCHPCFFDVDLENPELLAELDD